MNVQKKQQPPAQMSVKEAAEKWGRSPSWVKKMVEQGRVKFARLGGGAERAGAIVILQDDPPSRVEFGDLTAKQRAAWPKAAREKSSAVRPKKAKKVS